MVELSAIEAQLTKLGVRKTFFCKPEIRELRHILMDHETVVKFVNGRYHGGFAVLVATEQRLLLIDKKPLYLTVEDIRYDMIAEVDMNARLFDATVTLFTVNKQLTFSATRQQKLRELTAYVQKRVMEFRQYHHEEPAPDLLAQQFAQPAQAISIEPQRQAIFSTGYTTEPVQMSQASQHHYRLLHSIDLHKLMGGAALRASRRHHNPNPYTKAPLMVRQRWTSFS